MSTVVEPSLDDWRCVETSFDTQWRLFRNTLLIPPRPQETLFEDRCWNAQVLVLASYFSCGIAIHPGLRVLRSKQNICTEGLLGSLGIVVEASDDFASRFKTTHVILDCLCNAITRCALHQMTKDRTESQRNI